MDLHAKYNTCLGSSNVVSMFIQLLDTKVNPGNFTPESWNLRSEIFGCSWVVRVLNLAFGNFQLQYSQKVQFGIPEFQDPGGKESPRI